MRILFRTTAFTEESSFESVFIQFVKYKLGDALFRTIIESQVDGTIFCGNLTDTEIPHQDSVNDALKKVSVHISNYL